MTHSGNRFIGSAAFYKRLLTLVIPIIIQSAVTNFVTLIDNIMVGRLGTVAITGVSVVNQLSMVIFITMFGIVSAGSIFGAQYYGNGDTEGVRRCFRFKILVCVMVAVAGILILIFAGDRLIMLFLNDTTGSGGVAETLACAQDYMKVMLIGFVPFAMVNAYSSTLREAGETVVPMIASVIAILINMTFNYLLIFGKLGFPGLGVVGAAIATVMSRYVECAIIVIFAHARREKYQFVKEVYTKFYIPGSLLKNIIRTGAPLILNEVLFSLGITMINQSYSTRGLEVVAAMNITNTAVTIFMIINMSMGAAISVLVGQQLGAGRIEEAVDTDRKLLFFTFVLHCCIGVVMFLVAPKIPLLYNTSPDIREMAMMMLRIEAFHLPIGAMYNALYFTIRCGGKTLVTFFFDACFTMVISLPLVFCLARFSLLTVIAIFAIEKLADLIRVVLGLVIVKKGTWAKNLVGDKIKAESRPSGEA